LSPGLFRVETRRKKREVKRSDDEYREGNNEE
jgi:hypothetical protein